MIARNMTHTDRWMNADSYQADWKQRGELLLKLFIESEFCEGNSYRVAEFGCGFNAPIASLCSGNPAFTVQKFDIKKWDENTSVIDLNNPTLPVLKIDISVFSGVLEYLNDVEFVLRTIMNSCSYMLLSYAFLPMNSKSDDGTYINQIHFRTSVNGWRNHFTMDDLVAMLSKIGVISGINIWGGNQILFLVRNFSIDLKSV